MCIERGQFWHILWCLMFHEDPSWSPGPFNGRKSKKWWFFASFVTIAHLFFLNSHQPNASQTMSLTKISSKNYSFYCIAWTARETIFHSWAQNCTMASPFTFSSNRNERALLLSDGRVGKWQSRITLCIVQPCSQCATTSQIVRMLSSSSAWRKCLVSSFVLLASIWWHWPWP